MWQVWRGAPRGYVEGGRAPGPRDVEGGRGAPRHPVAGGQAGVRGVVGEARWPGGRR